MIQLSSYTLCPLPPDSFPLAYCFPLSVCHHTGQRQHALRLLWQSLKPPTSLTHVSPRCLVIQSTMFRCHGTSGSSLGKKINLLCSTASYTYCGFFFSRFWISLIVGNSSTQHAYQRFVPNSASRFEISPSFRFLIGLWLTCIPITAATKAFFGHPWLLYIFPLL